MNNLRSVLVLSLGVVTACSGCAAMQSAQSAASQSLQGLRPTTATYADPTEETSDPWIKQAGAEARGNRPKEKAVEPDWFMNLLRSPKARDIENNLGFE